MRLGDLLASMQSDPAGGFGVTVPSVWKQGRTAFGGLNAALAAHAARLDDGALPSLRGMEIAFLAPATPELRYMPTVLRRGRSMTFVAVDAVAEAGLCARALFTYGSARESTVVHSRVTAPAVAAPDDCPVVPLLDGVTPAFLEQFDLRLAAGGLPMSGAEPEFAWWVRLSDPAGAGSEATTLTVADVLPPAVSASNREFRPASTVTWTADFTVPLPDPSGWFLLTTSSDQAADGYSLQTMRCFAQDGSLIAAGRQLFAVF